MPRRAAYQILRSGSPTPLREVASVAASFQIEGRDRALLRRIVGTVLRRRGNLRALVAHFAKGKPSVEVSTLLHIGLAQIFFLDRVPDHAAVSETVSAVVDTIGLSKGRYANAVLRTAIRARRDGSCGNPRRDLPHANFHLAEDVFRDPEQHPLLWAEDALCLPAHMMKRWSKRFGVDRARELAHTFLVEPRLSVRVVRGEREALRAAFEEQGLSPVLAEHPQVLVFDSADSEGVVGSEAFQGGAITIQGEAALRAAELVGAREGERVLDLCAAPGGKTAVLAASGARVVAVDVDERKLDLLRSTLGRLGLEGAVELVESIGTESLPEGSFDAVLVDSPCSNTAVLGARPDARWRFGPKSLRSLGELQRRLLEQGAARVRPGGRLVWSTCSLEPEENAQLLRSFLADHPGWEQQDAHELLAESGEAGPVDGGFAALLVRGGEAN